MIYLDNAATTPISSDVFNEMLPFLKGSYGNAGSVHSMGREASKAIEKARARVAEFINAEPNQIIFTSGGSEGNNMVLSRGAKYFLEKNGKCKIVISAVEHDSVYNAALKMEQNSIAEYKKSRKKGEKEPNSFIKHLFCNHILGVNSDCVVSPEELENVLKEDDTIGLVSIMYVNNETGAVNPIKELCEICHKYGVLFHTDCVQAAGCNIIDVKYIDCDFATISGHKIYAPKGVGALYIKNPEEATPLICGGSTQEFGLRGGTENVAGIVGLGKACEVLSANKDVYPEAVYPLLQTMFYDTLKRELALNMIDDIVHINGNNKGKTLSVRFDGIDGETLVLMMDANHVCISSGSACHGHESNPSRVLIAMGLTSAEAKSSVRVSFSYMNTIEEVTSAAVIMASCVNKLINMK